MPTKKDDSMVAIWLFAGPPVRIHRKWLDEREIRRDCAYSTKAIWLRALPHIRAGRGQSPLDPVFP